MGYKIKRGTAESIALAARNTYPDEFIAMVGGNKGEMLIDELVVVPAIYGEDFAAVKQYLLPFDFRVLGSVHSHPSASNLPSVEDLATFLALGEIHIIIAYPFTLNTMKAFNSNGKEIGLEVVE